MAITHAGLNFYGTIGEPKISPWDFDVKRTKFFGTIGVSEIPGGIGSRKIVFPCWLHATYPSAAAAHNAIESLAADIGLHGTLTETGTVSRFWKHVTFDGFTQQRGPIPSSNLGWFFVGELNFTQLKPNGA